MIFIFVLLIFNFTKDSAEPECSVMLLGNKLDLAEDGMRKIKSEVGQKLAQVNIVVNLRLLAIPCNKCLYEENVLGLGLHTIIITKGGFSYCFLRGLNE